VSKWGRHIIPIIFLLLTLVPVLLMGGLQAFQYHIKQKVDKAFAEKELQTIVLPENEVNWYEQGKEIMVNGKMFDLKAYSICKGVFTAIGVYDEEETGVIALLGHFSEKDQSSFLLKLLLLSQCLLTFHFMTFSCCIALSLLKHKQHLKLTILNPYLGMIFPPPKGLYAFQFK